MKTLDEVIEALECCCAKGKTCRELGCPYTNDQCVDNGMEKDAIHYLKAFRDAKDILERGKDKYADAVLSGRQI